MSVNSKDLWIEKVILGLNKPHQKYMWLGSFQCQFSSRERQGSIEVSCRKWRLWSGFIYRGWSERLSAATIIKQPFIVTGTSFKCIVNCWSLTVKVRLSGSENLFTYLIREKVRILARKVKILVGLVEVTQEIWLLHNM